MHGMRVARPVEMRIVGTLLAMASCEKSSPNLARANRRRARVAR